MKRLITIAAVDEGTGIRLIYIYDEKGKVITSEKKVKYKSSVPSLATEYPSAELYEREIQDFFGLTFAGCPNAGQRLFKAEHSDETFLGAKKK